MTIRPGRTVSGPPGRTTLPRAQASGYPKGMLALYVAATVTVISWAQDPAASRFEIVEALVKAGADPNGRAMRRWEDELSDTPLTAVMRQRIDQCPAMVGFLIDKGSSLGVEVDFGMARATPLHIAIQSSSPAVLTSFLLARGADPNARGVFGRTPLIAAAASQYYGATQLAVVEALLNAGADIDACDETGRTALMWAAMANLPVAVSLLVRGADTDHADKDGETALMYAVREWNPGVVIALLDRRVDQEKRNAAGRTALDIARESNIPAEIQWLLENRGPRSALRERVDAAVGAALVPLVE
ncbi:MAG: ankyrin repeat domain-containing protein [Elusimicrobia bacterium]|nr:ankyrin repeat domain-containing protein [Elusimicrobiota bacterium]